METTNVIKKPTITDSDLQTLENANIIPKGTPPEQVAIFAKICNEKNLSPFTKQIYLLPFKAKETVSGKETWTTHYATITGIDGYRAIAERTGGYAGNDNYIYDEGITEYACRAAGKAQPITATATVYKLIGGQRVPYSATAAWSSYCPADNKAFNWKKMPFFMLGKCAEALALRKAFPEALGGLHAEEESAAFEILPKEGEKVIVVEDITKSEMIFAKWRKEIDLLQTSSEIKINSKPFIEKAIAEGLIGQHVAELQQYVNDVYKIRKAKP